MADYIELDVQLTADDEVVVMHDASAARTTGVDRKISEMTLEEVKQLDAGSSYSINADFSIRQLKYTGRSISTDGWKNPH